ncbi:MAG: adenylate cyclase, partial [Oceanicoccus sp.]
MSQSGKKILVFIPMALKLSLAVVFVLIAVTTIQGWMIAKQQSELLAEEMRKFGHGTTQLLVRQVKEPLLSQDDLSLERIIQSTIQHESVAGVEVRNSNGEMISSSGVTNNIRAISEQPLLWTDDNQRPYLSFLTSAYSNNLKVGEVLVTFHADVLNQLKNKARTYIIYSTLLLIMLGVVSSVLISTIVTLPIRRLIDISRRIADGDYQARFSKKRNDELGVLIESLNLMTEKLLDKIHIEQTFSRYVSPKVAKELLKDISPQELGGKEINGSVLFADIVGFTLISENMPAHEVSQLLNDYFTYIDQAAYQCDGHVDKYMGDCAMLVFGIPATQ